MGPAHLAVMALLLGSLHLGLGDQMEEEVGVEAKQMVISNSINNVQRSPFYPVNYYRPNPEPVSYYTRYLYPPPPPPPSRTSRSDWELLIDILYITGGFGSTAATTATTTTTNAACTYEEWGDCSANCKGTQTRDVTCSGVVRSESRDCNTQLGFQSDGWHRASNCYEYFLSGTTATYAGAQTNCEGLGAKLATVGIRDTVVRREVVAALFDAGEEDVFAFIGVDKISDGNTWAWLDGDTTEPDFWFIDEPDQSDKDCQVLASGNANSGHDSSCGSNHRYYCERATQ